eukprot:gene8029-1261_t
MVPGPSASVAVVWSVVGQKNEFAKPSQPKPRQLKQISAFTPATISGPQLPPAPFLALSMRLMWHGTINI